MSSRVRPNRHRRPFAALAEEYVMILSRFANMVRKVFLRGGLKGPGEEAGKGLGLWGMKS